MTAATPNVPEGCSLSLYPIGRMEAGTAPGQTQDEVIFTAECSCGEWEQEMSAVTTAAESVARLEWLRDHLRAEHDGSEPDDDAEAKTQTQP